MLTKNSKSADKLGRVNYDKPALGQFHLYNRPFYFTSSSSEGHCNDIIDILEKHDNKPFILALLTDNGPEVSPNNLTSIFYYGRLWLKTNLDQLIVASYAPYNSRFNPVEVAWGLLSKELAQIVICPEARTVNRISEEELKKLFYCALEELKDIWKNISYNNLKLKINIIIPNDINKGTFNDYSDGQNS